MTIKRGNIMNSNRRTARIVGALILIAYSVLAAIIFESKIIALFFQLISGAAVVGMAILMYPILKSTDKNLSLGYAVVKTIEGVVIVVVEILLFSLIINRVTYDLIWEYHIYLFGAAFLMLSYLFYKSELVPRFISVWGLIGSILMLVSTFLTMAFATSIPMFISHLPVISNELFLAVWLIVKGFNPSAVTQT
jgi:hypothetical protein